MRRRGWAGAEHLLTKDSRLVTCVGQFHKVDRRRSNALVLSCRGSLKRIGRFPGAFQFLGCRALVAQAPSLRVGRVSNPPAPLLGVWRCRPVAIGWLPRVGQRPACPRSTLAGRLEVVQPAGWKPALRGWPAPAGRPQVPCKKLRWARGFRLSVFQLFKLCLQITSAKVRSILRK
jgi:hypothetical protein